MMLSLLSGKILKYGCDRFNSRISGLSIKERSVVNRIKHAFEAAPWPPKKCYTNRSNALVRQGSFEQVRRSSGRT